MPITGTDFYLKPGESTDAYNARIATLRGDPAKPDAPAKVEPPSTGAAGLSQQDLEDAARSLGYENHAAFLADTLAKPSQSTTDFYNSAYSAAGLDELSSKILARQNDLATSTGSINENPWLHEASRVGRVRNLTNLAGTEIKNLQADYKTKLAGVHDLVKQHTSDLSANEKVNALKLAQLEKIAKENAANRKAASAAPKTVNVPAGNATYKWNPTTNSFEQVISRPPKAPAAADPNKIVAKFNNELTNKGALKQSGNREAFIKRLQIRYPQVDPKDIAKKVYDTYPDGWENQ